MTTDTVQPAAGKIPLSEQTVSFLTQECDRMLGLYQQAQTNAQSVFNFYLTFVTAVVGGVIYIAQLTSESEKAATQNDLTLIGVLFFAAIVGTVYLPALAGRYAQAARYAQAVDEIRRYLIDRLDTPVPPIYDSLVNFHPRLPGKSIAWLYWLMPAGTYQMFISIVNSAALGAMTWLFFNLADADPGRGVLATVIVFGVSTAIYNAYSHLVIARFGKGVNVDLAHDSPGWASRV